MAAFTINGEKMRSRTRAHRHLAGTLKFPKYYGNNLDALYDCLSEMPENTEIVFENVEAARRFLGDYADRMLDVFRELAEAEGIKFNEE